jgi:hypothetical protein
MNMSEAAIRRLEQQINKLRERIKAIEATIGLTATYELIHKNEKHLIDRILKKDSSE